MAHQPKYQVFISSTFGDLKDERDAVIRAVLEMGHIPVGMEMFSAADEEQWKIIARHIDESDYYAVICAHRYGSLTPEGLSYTRKEYEYARKQEVPCLGFVIEDGASWPADRIDMEATDVEGLNEFKARIKEKPVNFWTTADDLHSKFSISLMKAITASPRDGWVRASDSDSGQLFASEVARLSAENAGLRKQVSSLQSAETAEFETEKRETLDLLRKSKRKIAYRYKATEDWQFDAEPSLISVFHWLAPELLTESSVMDMAALLAMFIRKDQKETTWHMAAVNQVKDVLADLMTLDLVQPSTRRHAASDNEDYWSLTPFGIEMVKMIRKFSLTHPPAAAAPEDAAADDTKGTEVEELKAVVLNDVGQPEE